MPGLQQIKLLIFAFLLTALIGGCSKNEKQTQDNRLTAAVTVLPYADFVKQIAGNELKIDVLVPPGVSPEMFDPQPKQLSGLKEAGMYFRVGPVFQFESVLLDKIMESNPQIQIVDCSAGIETQNNNPHLWLDPVRVKKIIGNIYKELISKFPDKKSEFEKRKTGYISKLDSLDSILKTEFAPYRNRQILTYHPAWGYFTSHYGINEISIEKDGKAPSAKELAALIKYVRENKITTIFLEPQFDKDIAGSIAEQLNLKIVQVDPLPVKFLENMDFVARQFIKSFE